MRKKILKMFKDELTEIHLQNSNTIIAFIIDEDNEYVYVTDGNDYNGLVNKSSINVILKKEESSLINILPAGNKENH